MSDSLLTKLLIHVVLIIASMVMLWPIYIALMSFIVFFAGLARHTEHVTFLHQYLYVLRYSFVIALSTAFFKTLFALMSAYALVYFRFPFRRLCFLLILITLLLPIQIRIYPNLEILTAFHLSSTSLGLVLPMLTAVFATILFYRWLSMMPMSLTDMARLDGMRPLAYFWHVVLPLSRQSIILVFVLMFIYAWGQYLWPLMSMKASLHQTILVSVHQLIEKGGHMAPFSNVMTMIMLALLPTVILITAVQHLIFKRNVSR